MKAKAIDKLGSKFLSSENELSDSDLKNARLEGFTLIDHPLITYSGEISVMKYYKINKRKEETS